MQVYVLLDKDARVYGVVTDAEAAEEWLTFDGSFGFAECELDDYRSFIEALTCIKNCENNVISDSRAERMGTEE